MMIIMLLANTNLQAQETQCQWLSGTDKDNTVSWQFFCTAGRRSGEWTTIQVPSNWELQGFGKYNYGLDKDSVRGKEKGLYKYAFAVPDAWKNKQVNIVFEGSMTDTEVKINGQSAGPIHQGSFYRFKYDISGLLKYGAEKNLLEVTVAKHSANDSVNWAERKCDFWIFGGIFRPVYLEALPQQHIARVAIDAKANGNFTAQVFTGGHIAAGKLVAQVYTQDGTRFGAPVSVNIPKDAASVSLQGVFASPLLWSPEFPHLYKVVFTLLQNGQPVHTLKQKFGFRTVELRERDGIYVNNVKVKFKGVNRHSFWPESGRTMSPALSVEDVQLMKDMNMNAVRMSHYPPDTHFLDVCDSLGIFVLDELTGWHHAYDTEVGSKLVKEMMERDINHPSIIVWDNGNEGGHNINLDHLFREMDPQHRPLIHPWNVFGGTDTQHYINYDYGDGTHLHGHNIVFPTEFLHGLYDGGHAAGLEDFWEQMWREPLSAGGFLWVFADEAVVRTDKGGVLDADGNHGPDGILGPHHEKEGSYFAIREIWSPVYIRRREITSAFDGSFDIENRFMYTNTSQCSFSYRLATLHGPAGKDSSAVSGKVTAPSILPTHHGTLKIALPDNWRQYDVLYLTARDPHGREIYTWSWPIARPATIAAKLLKTEGAQKPVITESDSLYTVTANGLQFVFNRNTGILVHAKDAKGDIPFGNGPILCEGRPGEAKLQYRYEGPGLFITASFARGSLFQSLEWAIYPSGWLKMTAKYFPAAYDAALTGLSFSYPEQMVKSISWMGNGPYRVWKNRMKGVTLGRWTKAYNNTVTGENYIYPEFKGYYSDFYWLRMGTAARPFTIACASEDVFLRLYTPAPHATPFNTDPAFPAGDISFMHGITPIGTKSQQPDRLGPQGQKNMYYDYGKDPAYAKELVLYFNFGKNE